MSPHSSTPSSSKRRALAGTPRTLGSIQLHGPSLVAFLLGAGLTLVVFFVLEARGRERQRTAFQADVTPIVTSLRSAFERPLETVESAGAMFEASEGVTRAEFARYVKPALERHPGIRALEWIPVVPGSERERYEAAARADGLVGFQFRELGPGGMVRAVERGEYLPVYYMEPGHPLVLGFDCASEPDRRASAERARTRGRAVASERIHLLDDPPTSYAIAVFQPVFDRSQPHSPATVRGFTCEVFRIRIVAEPAIAESERRGIQLALLDDDAPPERRVLFESAPSASAAVEHGQRFESTLRYADRNWRIVLGAPPDYRAELVSSAWFALGTGLGLSTLLGLALSAGRVIYRLRRQVRAAQKLGQYTLLEKLGEGGVGVVYKARHAMLRRPTAIKLLSEATQDARRLARFQREVQLTGELTHPNTIAIYDYGRTPEGVFYYAMEYIDGITLEQLVRRCGPLPPARVVHLLAQAASALSEAHEVGLVHRDIKPSNLMICMRGGIPDFLKVMDFGLVKEIRGDGPGDDVTHSAATTVLGTPLYLAPEAISRSAEVDARVDLYALGAVAYFLLVGEPPFDGETILQVLSHHLHSTPPRPSSRVAVPASLELIVLRCLEKDPRRRPASARALLDELETLTGVDAWSRDSARAWWDSRGRELVVAIHDEQLAVESGRSPKPVAESDPS